VAQVAAGEDTGRPGPLEGKVRSGEGKAGLGEVGDAWLEPADEQRKELGLLLRAQDLEQ
jgi:hypothetical protein